MRLALALVFLVFVAAPAHAGDQDAAVAKMLACDAVKSSKARLKCFEAALGEVRNAFPNAAALAAEKAKDAQRVAKTEAVQQFGLKEDQTAEENDDSASAFGAEQLPRDADDEDDSIEAPIADIARTLRGKLIIVLQNGQIWRQIEGDTRSPHLPSDAENMSAHISRAFLGSYSLRIGDLKPAVKVRRVK